MRHALMITLALSSTPAFAGLREEMMNNPKVMAYVQAHPQVMFSGMQFMSRHPDIDKKGPAALKDPAIRKELQEAGLMEVMTIAMGQMKPAKAAPAEKPAAKPAVAAKPAPAAKPASAKVEAPAPRKVATAPAAGKPRLNTTYVVRKQAGLTADRSGFNLSSAGVHLTGKRAKGDNGKSNWLQVADAKGRTGWVNIGAKYNLGGGSAPTAVAARRESPKAASPAPTEVAAPLEAPAPKKGAPAELATGKDGPKVTELPPTLPPGQAKAAAAEPAPGAAVAPPVTPTATTKGEPAKKDEIVKTEPTKEEGPECAGNDKDFKNKPKLKKAFKDQSPFAQTWFGPVPGVKIGPDKEGMKIELTPDLQTMAAGMIPEDPKIKPRMEAMLDTMKKSGNRAPFEFMVCVDDDGKGPYRSDLGNKSYFGKDLRSVNVATPMMADAVPFTLDDPAAAAASK